MITDKCYKHLQRLIKDKNKVVPGYSFGGKTCPPLPPELMPGPINNVPPHKHSFKPTTGDQGRCSCGAIIVLN